jgi:hypothetical protein
MESPSFSPAPPAYRQDDVSTELRWRIRNAKYRSIFIKHGHADVQDYRDHLEGMKSQMTSDQLSCNTGLPNDCDPFLLDVQYSQAFGEVAQLLCEYQACLLKITPLQEEDILYLLLDRFAQSTGAGVYLEIRRAEEIQVYDSAISEPHVSPLMSCFSLLEADEEKAHCRHARAHDTRDWFSQCGFMD